MGQKRDGEKGRKVHEGRGLRNEKELDRESTTHVL